MITNTQYLKFRSHALGRGLLYYLYPNTYKKMMTRFNQKSFEFIDYEVDRIDLYLKQTKQLRCEQHSIFFSSYMPLHKKCLS